MRILAFLVLLLEGISLILLIKDLYNDRKNTNFITKARINLNLNNASNYLRRIHYYLTKWKIEK